MLFLSNKEVGLRAVYFYFLIRPLFLLDKNAQNAQKAQKIGHLLNFKIFFN